jgi:DNA-binding beta-propeller fold protein YncE
VDAAGNVYVVDLGTIHKVSPTGKVSLLAGNAEHETSYDSLDLDRPTGIAVDAAGTVYVADAGNHRIRKISPEGVVSTLAGIATLAEIGSGEFAMLMLGAQGSADGPATTARFNRPTGVAVDAAGTVYVADSENNTIRKISPAGEVSTLAGAAHTGGSRDGTGAAARFDDPYGVAVDAAGTVYVCDTGNHRLRTVSPTGVVRTLAGSGPAVSEERPPTTVIRRCRNG